MAMLDMLKTAFKSAAEPRTPIGAPFGAPINAANLRSLASGFDGFGGPSAFHYERAVDEGFLTNPIAQRAVRIVAEGVGQAPVACNDPALDEAGRHVERGPVADRDAGRPHPAGGQRLHPDHEGCERASGRTVRAPSRPGRRGAGRGRMARGIRIHGKRRRLAHSDRGRGRLAQHRPGEGTAPARRLSRRQRARRRAPGSRDPQRGFGVEPQPAGKRRAAIGRAGIRYRRWRGVDGRTVRTAQDRTRDRVRRIGQCRAADAARWRAEVAGDGNDAIRYGLRHPEKRRRPRDRARIRRAPDAARPARRQHLRQLPRGQPGAVAADAAAAGREALFGPARRVGRVVPRCCDHGRSRPDHRLVGRPRAVVETGFGSRVPVAFGEKRRMLGLSAEETTP